MAEQPPQDKLTKEQKEEKHDVEHYVDPQNNATLTKLTPAPDAGETTFESTPDGQIVPNPDFNG
jgi:hypothetical protein